MLTDQKEEKSAIYERIMKMLAVIFVNNYITSDKTDSNKWLMR